MRIEEIVLNRSKSCNSESGCSNKRRDPSLRIISLLMRYSNASSKNFSNEIFLAGTRSFYLRALFVRTKKELINKTTRLNRLSTTFRYNNIFLPCQSNANKFYDQPRSRRSCFSPPCKNKLRTYRVTCKCFENCVQCFVRPLASITAIYWHGV